MPPSCGEAGTRRVSQESLASPMGWDESGRGTFPWTSSVWEIRASPACNVSCLHCHVLGWPLFPVCGAFAMASEKPQLAQDTAVLFLSTLLCMDREHLGSVECFGSQWCCRYDLEILDKSAQTYLPFSYHSSPALIVRARGKRLYLLCSVQRWAHPLYWGKALHIVATVKGRFLIDDCSPELASFQDESGCSAFYGIYVSIFCLPLF